MSQSRCTDFSRHQKNERWGTDKTYATYQNIDAWTKNTCDRGNALKRLVENSPRNHCFTCSSYYHRDVIYLGAFSHAEQGGQFATSCLFSCTSGPFGNATSIKGKNLLPQGANSFILAKMPFQKKENIRKTYLYNFDPLKPHFYTVKLGFTGVYISFLISAQKHRLWVLVRTASARRF